jgi:MFS family permease
VTLLMVAGNRMSPERRGASLGVLAAALMLGVTIGSPLGGWLVEHRPEWVYRTGAFLFVIGAAVCLAFPPAPAAGTAGRSYRWNRRAPETWIPLGYAFLDRFSIGVFVSTFTLFLAREHALGAGGRGALVALFMIPFAALCYPAGRVAERHGWLVPMLTANVAFGVVYASYGLVAAAWLPLVMVLSGVCSAFMFTPSLLLVSDLARRGHGEGLFGAFQVAGSLGFLAGPIAGGILAGLTRGESGRPAYEAIFAGVGAAELVLAAVSWTVLRRVSAEVRLIARDA